MAELAALFCRCVTNDHDTPNDGVILQRYKLYQRDCNLVQSPCGAINGRVLTA